MSILRDLTELLKSGVISKETAENISEYYLQKISDSPNRLVIAFGILGALLVGSGIILIIAHNWDNLSRITKTIIAFAPLIISQVFCGYVLYKKRESVTWREGVSILLFFSIGASISMISQIYNIPGEISGLLLTWMLLTVPVIYLMNSSAASILYLAGVTYYAGVVSYWNNSQVESYLYWLLLILALPHYYLLYKKMPKSNFMIFHNWIIPLSVTFALGGFAKNHDELMFIAYISLFGLYYLIGNVDFFKGQNPKNNGYLSLGSLGTISLLLVLSFNWFWDELINTDFQLNLVLTSPEFIISTIISIIACGLLYGQWRKHSIRKVMPLGVLFLLFIIVFFIGLSFSISILLVNLLVFGIGLITIISGARSEHLGILNYGLLIITALMICRFFDADLSFVVRGILFVSVGIGFFVSNYWMLKKRKENEE